MNFALSAVEIAEDKAQIHQALLHRCQAIANEWFAAISRTCFVPFTAAEIRQHLVELTADLITLLFAESFDHHQGEAIGASLASFHYLEPEALGGTQQLLAQQLLQGLSAAQVLDLLPRLTTLLAAFATGFYRQARQTILVEQEWIHGALTREIRRAHEVLRKAYIELEQQVQERTAELRATNEALQHEIGERALAEEALGNAVRQWHATFDAISDAVCVLDLEGRILRCNKAMMTLLGKPFSEIIGRTCWELVHDVSEPLEGCPVVRMRETGHRETSVLPRGDRWFHSSADPILDEQGNLAGAVHILSDITERRQAEKELEGYRHHLEELVKERTELLRASEERYRSLFDGVPVGLYRTTPEGQILDANPFLVRMLGYPDRESLLALNATDLYVDAEDRRRWQSLLEQEGIVAEFEMQLRCHDGRPIWVRNRVRAAHDADGRLLYYEGCLEDITERKQAQELLMRTERLAAMGRLAAALAHEINNPLQGIGSSLELVLGYPLAEEERQAYLRAALREVERLMALTNRVLNFARPPLVERQASSMAEVVHHALTLLSKEFRSSDIQVCLDIPEALPPVLISSGHLLQVFFNLMINAIEAMPNGGELRISSRLAGDRVEVTFADSGPGIPPNVMARLFEPFCTTKANGTGLGLATSYSIIQQYDGTITASNAPDGGATFTIALPVAPLDEPHVAGGVNNGPG